MSGGAEDAMSLQTVKIDADLLDHSKKIVTFYHANEADIRKICEPHWAINPNKSQAQMNAAHEIIAQFSTDALTALLLVGMFFENNPD